MTAGRESADERLGTNLRILREQKQMSQAELARRMADEGHGWHQSTVARTEAGRQSVRITEGEALAGILGVPIARLLWASAEAKEAALIDWTHGNLRRSWDEAADAVARLEAARYSAEHTLAEHSGSEYPMVCDASRELGISVQEATLDAAAEEGARRFEKLRQGGQP